jgi:hypothetical protein
MSEEVMVAFDEYIGRIDELKVCIILCILITLICKEVSSYNHVRH